MRAKLSLAVVLLLLVHPTDAARTTARRPRHPARSYRPSETDLEKVSFGSQGWTPKGKCEERWRDAPLDHFSWAAPTETYRQRYFFCPHLWEKKRDALASKKGNTSTHEATPLLRGVASLDASSPETTALDAGFTKSGPPIFFYTGNEANVELYLNATGLMW